MGGLWVKFNEGGWPPSIPFTDLSSMRCGTKVFNLLQSRLDSGELKIVPATEENKRNTGHEPWLVIRDVAQHAVTLGALLPLPQPDKPLAQRITDFAPRFELSPSLSSSANRDSDSTHDDWGRLPPRDDEPRVHILA